MAKKRKAKQPRPRSGFLTKVVIVSLLAALGWQLYGLQDHLTAAQTEKEHYAARVAEQKRENAALKADIEEGPTEEKLLEKAQDEGYIKQDGYLFISGG